MEEQAEGKAVSAVALASGRDHHDHDPSARFELGTMLLFHLRIFTLLGNITRKILVGQRLNVSRRVQRLLQIYASSEALASSP